MPTYYARTSGNVNGSIWATTPTGTASNLFSSFTNQDTLVANSFTVTLNVDTTVLEVRTDTTGGATTGGGFTLNNSVTLNANVYSGGSHGLTFSLGATNSATINGNVFGSNIAGFSGATMSGAGTLTINGSVTGGSILNAYGINFSGAGILNINGNVLAGTVNSNNGVYQSGNGTLNIVGNVIGGSGTNSFGVSLVTNGIINIIGNVIGGSGGSGAGVSNQSIGTVIIIGVVSGGSQSPGITNTSTGSVVATRAKGNGFGNGSVGLTGQVGISASQNSLTRVYEIEYGDLGQSPTSGPVFLFPSSSNVALFYRSGTTKKTLVDASNSSGLLPSTSDVRSGITYNAGNNIGTMGVPSAQSVALGVPVDNTTGTAVLTTDNIGDIWNYPVSGISVSNSIGERLKNCSTVASMGQQLAAALNNVQ